MDASSGSTTDLTRARRYYAGLGLGERVRASLDAATTGEDLAIEALAPIDQNHVGGAEQTRRLARASGLVPGSHVLDLGSALGGPTRHLTREFGWRVVGLDLSFAFCSVAQFLGTRLEPGPLPGFVCGSALQLPFPDGAFDGVWTQHAAMNMSPKDALFSELARVLRSGGRLLLHEVLRGSRQPIRLPVPWASTEDLNQLSGEEDLRTTWASTGLRVVEWNDTSGDALEWFRSQAGAPGSEIGNGVDLVFGESGPEKRHNVVRNLLERRIRVVEAVVEKESS